MKFDMKVLVRCRIRFESAWIHYATVLTGLSFFLLVVNFFGLRNLMDCSFGEIVFSMAIPMAIWIGFMVLLRGIHFQNARLYGVLGALYCVCMIAHTFSYDNIFLTVFAVVCICLRLSSVLVQPAVSLQIELICRFHFFYRQSTDLSLLI